MRPHQPVRDDYSILQISRLVRRQATRYHTLVSNLRYDREEMGFSDDTYFRILREIRNEAFTNLHSGLRGLYSARLTRRRFRHSSMLTINERSHSFTPGSSLPVRYITGIVEGLWDIINTETHFPSP